MSKAMNGINIPGSPGTAMALASGASIYSAAIVQDNSIKIYFLYMTVGFIIATIIIEGMHIWKDIRKKDC